MKVRVICAVLLAGSQMVAMAQAAAPFVQRPATEWIGLDPVLVAMQGAFVNWFVHRRNFGISRMPGSEEAELMQGPPKVVSIDGKDYRIVKVQLISLIRPDPPKVYVPLEARLSPPAKLKTH